MNMVMLSVYIVINVESLISYRNGNQLLLSYTLGISERALR